MSRAGSASLALGELGALAPLQFLPVCSVQDEGRPRPRTVRIRIAKQGEEESNINHHLPGGVYWRSDSSAAWVGSSVTAMCGLVRFVYGSQGMLRTLLCDLQGGEYQIPPCEYLTVTAARYTPSTDAAALAAIGFPAGSVLECAGEIADGCAEDFTPMMYTAPSSWPGGAGTDALARVHAPPGAYAFELYPDTALAAQNTFEVSPPGARRDFANGVWTPPTTPLPLLSSSVAVQARGSSPQRCKLVFFVR